MYSVWVGRNQTTFEFQSKRLNLKCIENIWIQLTLLKQYNLCFDHRNKFANSFFGFHRIKAHTICDEFAHTATHVIDSRRPLSLLYFVVSIYAVKQSLIVHIRIKPTIICNRW